MMSPVQKHGVSPDWNMQAHRYAQSITDGFNKMGQQIGSDLVRVGKHLMGEEEKEAEMNDAHSLSLYKIKSGEMFSEVEQTIRSADYKTLEAFDEAWDSTLVPDMDKRHAAIVSDGDVIWNADRLGTPVQRHYEVAREAFRVKMRGQLDAQLTERRRENAAAAISRAGEQMNFEAIAAGYDAAITAGVPASQAQELASGAVFEAFARTQHAAMEEHGLGSADYKIALHGAYSSARDRIANNLDAILSADAADILQAWRDNDFSEILATNQKKADSGKRKTKSAVSRSASRNETASGDQATASSQPSARVGTDWAEAERAGLAAVEAQKNRSLAELAELKDISPEKRRSLEEQIFAEETEARAAVRAQVLAQEDAAKKEQREIVKSVLSVAANDEGKLKELLARITGSRTTAKNFNEKLQWMRLRKDSDYDEQTSSAALFQILANVRRFKDDVDPAGESRMAAFALARKHCNARDYAVALRVLTTGAADPVVQQLKEYGVSRLFEATGLDPDDLAKAHRGTDDDALIAAYCAQVVDLAATLPPVTFRSEIELLCDTLKKTRSRNDRIRYMSRLLDAAARNLAPVDEQMRDKPESVIPTERTVREIDEEDRRRRDEEERVNAAKMPKMKILTESLRKTPIGMPGMLPM